MEAGNQRRPNIQAAANRKRCIINCILILAFCDVFLFGHYFLFSAHFLFCVIVKSILHTKNYMSSCFDGVLSEIVQTMVQQSFKLDFSLSFTSSATHNRQITGRIHVHFWPIAFNFLRIICAWCRFGLPLSSVMVHNLLLLLDNIERWKSVQRTKRKPMNQCALDGSMWRTALHCTESKSNSHHIIVFYHLSVVTFEIFHNFLVFFNHSSRTTANSWQKSLSVNLIRIHWHDLFRIQFHKFAITFPEFSAANF